MTKEDPLLCAIDPLPAAVVLARRKVPSLRKVPPLKVPLPDKVHVPAPLLASEVALLPLAVVADAPVPGSRHGDEQVEFRVAANPGTRPAARCR